jgi:hypothetical protein
MHICTGYYISITANHKPRITSHNKQSPLKPEIENRLKYPYCGVCPYASPPTPAPSPASSAPIPESQSFSLTCGQVRNSAPSLSLRWSSVSPMQWNNGKGSPLSFPQSRTTVQLGRGRLDNLAGLWEHFSFRPWRRLYRGSVVWIQPSVGWVLRWR